MKLSVIIPVFNSSKILEDLIERIIKTSEKLNMKNNFEVIMINDNSSDNSWDVLKKLSKNYNFLTCINLTKNFGQHNAIMAGLNNAVGDCMITLDDDLQHPPEFFPEIINKLKNFDVCYTNYKNRKHVGWKRAVSALNNFVSSFLLNKPLEIYMSSYRGINKKIVDEIIKFKKPDVYLDGLIVNTTKNIGMITVDHHARKIGESNYTFKKLLILWSNMIINFSFFPLRYASILGIILKLIIKLFRKKNNGPQYEILEKI